MSIPGLISADWVSHLRQNRHAHPTCMARLRVDTSQWGMRPGGELEVITFIRDVCFIQMIFCRAIFRGWQWKGMCNLFCGFSSLRQTCKQNWVSRMNAKCMRIKRNLATCGECVAGELLNYINQNFYLHPNYRSVQINWAQVAAKED